MYINGEWISSNRAFSIFNPVNGTQIGEAHDGSAAHAASAIDAALNAFSS